jgi:hypothetical protein
MVFIEGLSQVGNRHNGGYDDLYDRVSVEGV